MKRMLSGIKPTGEMTLGNYIGALRNFVKYQDDYELYVFIANLHCITVPIEPKELRRNLKDAIAIYLACGLDPEKSTIFLQSDVPEHAQLGWIMTCMSYMGELGRMTQFKEKTANATNESISTGLFVYPPLMAADILLYDADYVPVGEDQKQHVELTRDLAQRFNNRYSPTFTVPEPLIPQVGARIMSLSDPSKKMSKSEESNKGCIYLLDDLKVARKKIMSAVTDMYAKVNYDKENQPGVSNLLEIMSSLSGESIDSIVARYEGKGYGEFKREVADVVCAELEKIQNRYNEIINSNLIEETLRKGAEQAHHIAFRKLKKVQKKMGIDIF
ncbi:MAG: tryptophan--tRNA ligase [Erysipelotrichaceae bacterium]|nr:tryptophan--tRNA ligase [Erysipelotrichaceae bacterium]MBR2545260.1 tryptophan--tRNA ligase [Erysipelotrichaceae bacterium]MBR2702043.1 tryptophan--tRNA ligase [Erysipelotrichaceae bacterium]MBR2745558.1 tryptophan--tRNA ligase [Erysipelotrichaceae bacterium]